jgi:hypothetical protein
MEKSYVYVMEAGDYVKVGYAKNVNKRRGDVQVGSPVEVKVLATQACDGRWASRLEGAFHDILRGERSSGEWFNKTERVKAALSVLGGEPPVQNYDDINALTKMAELRMSSLGFGTFDIDVSNALRQDRMLQEKNDVWQRHFDFFLEQVAECEAEITRLKRELTSLISEQGQIQWTDSSTAPISTAKATWS